MFASFLCRDVQVEEIARFALESFPVSQPVELRQYLEQFLGQSKVSQLRSSSSLSHHLTSCRLILILWTDTSKRRICQRLGNRRFIFGILLHMTFNGIIVKLLQFGPGLSIEVAFFCLFQGPSNPWQPTLLVFLPRQSFECRDPSSPSTPDFDPFAGSGEALRRALITAKRRSAGHDGITRSSTKLRGAGKRRLLGGRGGWRGTGSCR